MNILKNRAPIIMKFSQLLMKLFET